VFRHPANGQDFIKRVVGVPGDTVQMRNGVLFLNGSAAPQVQQGLFTEAYERQGPIGTTPICIEMSVSFGDDCNKMKSIETLPDGTQHAVLDAGPTRLDNTGVTRVPEGMFYFVGDNRDNSTDSRVAQPSGVGLVPYENLIGRADRVMFSSAGRSLFFVWTWRMDRFFKAIE
jgi:signal peptidase I